MTKQRNTVKYNKNTGDISVTNDSVSLSYEESNSSREQEVEGKEFCRPRLLVSFWADSKLK